MHWRKPSPGTVVAAVALFFALGGTAVAAHHYLITSTSQIKPSVLKALHGKAGAQGLAGPQGPAGPIGPVGPVGAVGPAGPVSTSALTEVDGPANLLPKKTQKGPESEVEGVEGSFAICPSGQHVVSGGINAFAGKGGTLGAEFSGATEDRQAWVAVAENGGELEAIAYCAGAGKAVVARSPRTARAQVSAEAKRLIRKVARRFGSRVRG